MPPTPITPSWVSLWQYRYTASAMGQQGRELLSHGVAAIILFDDTVESLISFTDFIIKKEVMELKRESYCSYGTNYLASKQLKNTFSKQGAYLKTNLKVRILTILLLMLQRLMELILN
jgi:hypothetical protein